MLGDLVLVEPDLRGRGRPGPGGGQVRRPARGQPGIGSAQRLAPARAAFYDELAPATPVRVPRVYASWYDADSAEFLVVQEAIDNDPTVDQMSGIAVDQAELVLLETARLHATWWDHPRLATLDWLPRLDGPARRDNLATITRTGWEALCDLLGDALTPRRARPRRGTARPRGRGAGANGRSSASTLIHSDLRADNLLFSPDGTAVTLIDWQGVGHRPGWLGSRLLPVPIARRRHPTGQRSGPARSIRPAKPNSSDPS